MSYVIVFVWLIVLLVVEKTKHNANTENKKCNRADKNRGSNDVFEHTAPSTHEESNGGSRCKNIEIKRNTYANNIVSTEEYRQQSCHNAKIHCEAVSAVLLTKSGKGGGACVAAFDLDNQKMLRFVSNPKTAAEIPFSSLRGINALDIVKAEKICACPVKPQSENILVDCSSIKKIGLYDGDIENIREQMTYPDSYFFTRSGNNRIFSVTEFNHSLEIICVNNLRVYKIKKYDGCFTTRADFIYMNRHYRDFRVTDFNFDLRKSADSEKNFPYADLVLSIPMSPFVSDNGDNKGYYIFVAAIFPMNNCAPQNTANRDVYLSSDDLHTKCRSNRAFELWTFDEDKQLLEELNQQIPISKIAINHQRSENAINARIQKLNSRK